MENLSEELIDSILSNFAALSSLASCAQVNHTFRRIAIPKLYHTLRFSRQVSKTDRAHLRLEYILKHSTHLLHCVRCIIVASLNHLSQAQLIEQLSSHLVSHEKLQTLDYHPSVGFHSVLPLLQMPSLKSFTFTLPRSLDREGISQTQLFDEIFTNKRLTGLRVYRPCSFPGLLSRSGKLPQISCLAFRLTETTLPDWCSIALWIDLRELKRLAIRFNDLVCEAALCVPPAFAKMETLTSLQIAFPTLEASGHSTFCAFFSSLGLCRSLQHLDFDTWTDSHDVYRRFLHRAQSLIEILDTDTQLRRVSLSANYLRKSSRRDQPTHLGNEDLSLSRSQCQSLTSTIRHRFPNCTSHVHFVVDSSEDAAE